MWPLDFPSKVSQKSKISIIVKSSKHYWDDVSTRMVRICGKSLVKPLFSIFNLSFLSGIFPSQWKKANVVHKKVTGAYLKTIEQYRFFRCLANYLKSAFMMYFTIALQQIIFFLRASLVFVRVILVFHSCYL